MSLREGGSQVLEMRVMEHMEDANKCWIHGDQLGRLGTFHCNILKEFVIIYIEYEEEKREGKRFKP